MPFIELLHSFDKTNLDLEDEAPSGGPINASNYGHQQTYTPQNKFRDSPEGDKSTGLLKDEGFDGIEGLDLENNGPINVPLYNHNQNYTPTDEFINSPAHSGLLDDAAFDGPDQLDIETDPKTFFPKTGKQEFGFTQQWGPEANQYEFADLGEEGSGLYKNGFDGDENLDIETNPRTFFPKTNGRNSTFVQNWGPNANEFRNSEQGSKTGGKLYPTTDPTIATLTDAFDGNLDLENNDPAVVGISGGGKKGFQPQYTPKNGQGYVVPGTPTQSDLVEIGPGGEVVDLGSLKVTALDIASDEAGVEQGGSGGPRRIVNQSKKSFNSGQYTVIRAGGLGVGSIVGMNGQGGGVITQTLHTYTPQNPYFEAGGLDLIPIGSPQSVNSVPFTPKNNIVESNEEQGYNATIK